MLRTYLIAVTLTLTLGASAVSADVIDERFEDIDALGADGWVMANNSSASTSGGWFQGNASVFAAHGGLKHEYITADFTQTGPGVGSISNWLLTPELSLSNGDTVSFWTRTVKDSSFPSHLQVRLSTAGDSTDVGFTSGDVGVFDTLLLEVNPPEGSSGFPDQWQQYTISLSGLPSGSAGGRLAFRYFAEDSGIGAADSKYIGIDSFRYTPIPGPAAGALLGMAAIMGGRRRRTREAPRSHPCATGGTS